MALGTPTPQPIVKDDVVEGNSEETDDIQELEEIAQKVSGHENQSQEQAQTKKENNNVFISHGKNKEILQQLKNILTFGKFNPIVSIEKNTASIPVPEKVFDDMRLCDAAVIHVGKEGEYLDHEGNTHARLNENVLIEIGAAIALYKNRFVLLVEKGVKLPSNLQGLYRCEYEGNVLDYDATMKLLKTFNEFR